MYDEELKTKKDSETTKKPKQRKISLPTFRFNVNFKSVWKKFGILALCVFAFIFISTKMSQNSANKVLEENLETMKTGAYKYFKENERPSEIDEEYNITLQDLIDEDIIKPLTDKKGNVCDSSNSTMTLTKKTKTKYDLVTHLDCNQQVEDKSFSLTYSNSSSSNNTSDSGKTTYYKLQKEVTTDNFHYSCPNGYTLKGNYCYGASTTLTATPVGKYKTTSAKTTKATFKKPEDEFEYVEVVEMKVDASYQCTDKDAILRGDKCILVKEPKTETNSNYSCQEGVLDGTKCVITKEATKVNFKYTCPSGKLVGNDQCRLTRDYYASYSCPSDYPYRDGDRCYNIEKAERDWGEWRVSSKKTFTKEMDDTDSKHYELVDTYEGANGKTRYVYKVYNRSKEYICYPDDNEDVELKGNRCYYYVDGYEDKACPNGYSLSDDETECYKFVNATKKRTSVSYTCPDGYSKSGSGSKTKCVKKVEANQTSSIAQTCDTGYQLKTENNQSSCIKEISATRVEETIEYVCPTGYEQEGTGKDSKCYKKTTKEGYYYCKNPEARLEEDKCVIDAKTELVGYKCPSGYDLDGDKCIKVLAGDKVKATKTNNPDIDVTYKWSDKKSESGWTWTGETKEM